MIKVTQGPDISLDPLLIHTLTDTVIYESIKTLINAETSPFPTIQKIDQMTSDAKRSLETMLIANTILKTQLHAIIAKELNTTCNQAKNIGTVPDDKNYKKNT